MPIVYVYFFLQGIERRGKEIQFIPTLTPPPNSINPPILSEVPVPFGSRGRVYRCRRRKQRLDRLLVRPARSPSLHLRGANVDDLAVVQDGIRAIHTVSVAYGTARGVGGDVAEGQVGVDGDGGTVDGNGDGEGVFRGGPELKSDVVGAGLLGGGSSSNEAGEESGGGSNELHCEWDVEE